jgi:hypothetical protein
MQIDPRSGLSLKDWPDHSFMGIVIGCNVRAKQHSFKVGRRRSKNQPDLICLGMSLATYPTIGVRYLLKL